MYIGNGQVVHAQSSDTGIVISSMNYNTPTRAARILEID
jgi:cell wall-associated NlpC family hydrolase